MGKKIIEVFRRLRDCVHDYEILSKDISTIEMEYSRL
jgi:hypothetical protein